MQGAPRAIGWRNYVNLSIKNFRKEFVFISVSFLLVYTDDVSMKKKSNFNFFIDFNNTYLTVVFICIKKHKT